MIEMVKHVKNVLQITTQERQKIFTFSTNYPGIRMNHIRIRRDPPAVHWNPA